jgi:hypothetical protein
MNVSVCFANCFVRLSAVLFHGLSTVWLLLLTLWSFSVCLCMCGFDDICNKMSSILIMFMLVLNVLLRNTLNILVQHLHILFTVKLISKLFSCFVEAYLLGKLVVIVVINDLWSRAKFSIFVAAGCFWYFFYIVLSLLIIYKQRSFDFCLLLLLSWVVDAYYYKLLS